MIEVAAATAPTSAELERVIIQAGRYEPGKSLEPFRQIETWVVQAGAEPSDRKTMERALIRLLEPNASFESRRFACKQLGIIGSEAALPALARMLHEDQTAALACLALTTYPKGAADKTLRTELGSATGNARLQIINTLGDRRDAKAVALLSGLAHGEGATSAAAISALGKIGNASAWKALAQLRLDAGATEPRRGTEAVITCADHLAAAGDHKLARSIYTKVLDSSGAAYIRRSAFAGLLRLDDDGGEARILQTLQGSDTVLRPVAIGAVRGVKTKDASRRFGEELRRLPPPEQVWMIESLAVRGDAPARDAIARSLGADDASVRLAAIAALGRIGSEIEVPLLVRAAAKTIEQEEFRAIESALNQLGGGPETDRSIISQFKEASGTAQVCLISALARRQGTAAGPVILEATTVKDPAVAKAAFRALGKVAAADVIPMLLARLNQPLEPGVRAEAQAAASVALARIEDVSHRSAIVREMLNHASAPESRISFINLLPGCADAEALGAVRRALTDRDAEVRVAAASALGDWPDVVAWDALVQLYRAPENEPARGVALRGLVRLAAEGNAQVGGPVLERYMQLLSGANGDADRKLILSALGGVARPEALQLVFPLLTNSAVRPEAEVAVRKIAESIKSQHPEAAKEALARLEQH